MLIKLKPNTPGQRGTVLVSKKHSEVFMTLVKSAGNKKVNLDFNKEFINIFSEKIRSSDIEFSNHTLKDLHESDIANLIENLSNEPRIKLI